jgi:hypothetical protein
MRYVVLLIALLLVMALPLPTRAANYVGKISLVEYTANGTRFYIRSSHLSLYATGDQKDILLEAFFHKSNVSVGYASIACPGGISGSCGKVTFISIDEGNLAP